MFLAVDMREQLGGTPIEIARMGSTVLLRGPSCRNARETENIRIVQASQCRRRKLRFGSCPKGEWIGRPLIIYLMRPLMQAINHAPGADYLLAKLTLYCPLSLPFSSPSVTCTISSLKLNGCHHECSFAPVCLPQEPCRFRQHHFTD